MCLHRCECFCAKTYHRPGLLYLCSRSVIPLALSSFLASTSSPSFKRFKSSFSSWPPFKPGHVLSWNAAACLSCLSQVGDSSSLDCRAHNPDSIITWGSWNLPWKRVAFSMQPWAAFSMQPHTLDLTSPSVATSPNMLAVPYFWSNFVTATRRRWFKKASECVIVHLYVYVCACVCIRERVFTLKCYFRIMFHTRTVETLDLDLTI